MNNIRKGLRLVWLAGFLFAWQLCTKPAAANTIPCLFVPVADDNIVVPAGGLNGWFFNPDPDLPFPSAPDPSQPWTSPENIATMNYWLSLVLATGDDPTLLAELYGLGMIGSPVAPPAQISQSIVSNNQVISQENAGDVPEPGTLGLLGGGLVLLWFRAAPRTRRMRARG